MFEVNNNQYFIDYFPTSNKPEVREKVLKFGNLFGIIFLSMRYKRESNYEI